MIKKMILLIVVIIQICGSVSAMSISDVSNMKLAVNAPYTWQEYVAHDLTRNTYYRSQNLDKPWKGYRSNLYTLLDLDNPFEYFIRRSNGKDSVLIPIELEKGMYSAPTTTIDSIITTYLSVNEINSDNVGIYYINLKTGEEYSHNGETLFIASSTWKLGVGIAIEDFINNGTITKQTGVYYTPSFDVGGLQFITDQFPHYSYIPVSTLMYKMLVLSGNVSAALLWSKLNDISGNNLAYYRNLVDAGEVEYDRSNNSVTPKFQAYMMKKLYEQQADYQYSIWLLKQAYRNDYASKYDKSKSIIHKCGFFHGYIGDVVLNLDPEHPYALAIYTANVEEPKELIGIISAMVHDMNY